MELVLHTYADGSQEWVGQERIAEIKRNEIVSLKAELTSLDYKTIKRLQGVLSDEEWEATKAECAALRRKINELEAELTEMEEI